MADDRAAMGIGRVAWRVVGAAAFVAALAWLPLHALPLPSLRAPGLPPQVGAAAIEDAAALLPADLWIALDGRGLGAAASGWSGSRLQQRLLASAAWRKFEQSPQHAQLLAGLGFAQLVSGMKPASLLGALLGEQIAAGLAPDGDAPGVVAVVRSMDAETAEHLVSVARGLAAARKGDGAKVRAVSCGGVDATVLDEKLWFAALDRFLLMASSERLLEGVIGRARAGSQAAANSPLMAALRAQAPDDALLRFAVDTRRIASTRPEGRLLPPKSDNFFGAMLLGDLAELASRADRVCGSLDARGDELSLAIDVPGEPAALPVHFRSFGHASAQLPLPLLAPAGTLMTIALRRDWARFWEDRVELCDPKTEKEFADLKTNLGLFFGGKSLPDDVLPRIGDEILFVLARQTYPGIAQPPLVKFPAGAFVWRAKADPEKLGRDFAIGVHSFLGLINLGRAQENQTPLLPFVEPFEGVTVWGGRCLSDDERPADPARFNISPAACWVGDRVIVSSSEELLHALVRELQRPITVAAAPGRSGLAPAGCTSFLRVDGAAAQALALDDRDVLVSNAVLNDGKPQAEAEAQIDLLCELLGQLSHATLSTQVRQDGMRVVLAVALTPFAPATRAGSAAPAPGGPQ